MRTQRIKRGAAVGKLPLSLVQRLLHRCLFFIACGDCIGILLLCRGKVVALEQQTVILVL